MKKLLTIISAIALAGSMSHFVAAAEVQTPQICSYEFEDGGMLSDLSDNGEWALVAFGTNDLAEVGKPKIVNVLTGAFENLQTEAEIAKDGTQVFNSVTNDGNIIVGSFKGAPAYFTRSTRSWTILPTPAGCDGAVITKVTPDGRYAIGRGSKSADMWYCCGAMWDLQSGQPIALPNLPVKDMSHEIQNQQQLLSISNDGRYILGSLSYSYLQPVAPCVFVYDRETSTAKFIGFDTNDTADWTPWAHGLAFVDEGMISANGKYVACHVWMYEAPATEGAVATVDGDAIAYYEVETGKFEVIPGSAGMACPSVDNYGTVYAATPAGSPIREWSVYKGGYWYPIKQILSQRYNINFSAASKYSNTGTVMDLTGDGKTFSVMCDPNGESYSLRMPEPPANSCDDINLLGNYVIEPANGLSFSKIRSIEIIFDRDIECLGSANAAALTKADGTLVRNSSGFAVSASNNKTLVVTFRPTELENGQTYTVTIPAGTVCVKGDNSKKNNEISVKYVGRANTAVQVTNIYPKDGATLAKLDNSSNAIIISYDAQLTLSENAAAQLYHIDGEALNKVCDLNCYASGSSLMVYPSATQFLYLDNKYRVVVEAGAVTDYSGAGASAEIVLNFTGSYVREISHDTANLFKDDFSNQSQSLVNFMRYEGDHKTPNSDMQSIGFDADNQPWNFSVSENKASTDYCAASTSMYSPAGQSDDWMVIPQLEIPDEYVTLNFKAQSYKFAKTDRLKVYVWVCDENFTALSKDIMDRFKAGADKVFDEQLSPGTNEEDLSDGWVDYSVDLAAYAGKKIYIGFQNDNNDQSCVFVDNVAVTREMKFFVSLVTAESVVNQESVQVKGQLTANAEGEVFTSAKLTLKDSKGTTIDEINASGLNLKKSDAYTFTFAKNLPLVKGQTNKFQILVEMGNYSDKVDCAIKNLAFKPVKRVVLEEMTGTTCGNCPIGHIAIEHLKDIYGDLFIPVAIHTYEGDLYAAGLSSYTSFLGLNGAPTAIIQRSGEISSPMFQDPITAEYSLTDGSTLWTDRVSAEFETPADADVNTTYEINKTAGTFDLDVTLTSAVDMVNLNLNIFIVMLEDNIVAFQDNYFSAVEDAALGEWGLGGKYAQQRVYDYVQNHVAMACWGTSYNGTPGYLPQSLAAGESFTAQLVDFEIPENIEKIENTKIVVMIIDGNTDKLVNAVCVKADGSGSVEDISMNDANCTILAECGSVNVAAEGHINATIYTLDGKALASGDGNDSVSITANGYKGVAVVLVKVGDSYVVKKVKL